MNLAELYRKLIAAARSTPPSDRVPYAFEKRILALLAARPILDRWALWARALWRAAALCVMIVLLLGAWSLVSPQAQNSNVANDAAAASGSNDLSQAFEKTMLAAVDQDASYSR